MHVNSHNTGKMDEKGVEVSLFFSSVSTGAFLT